MRAIRTAVAVVLSGAVAVMGCDKDKKEEGAAGAASAESTESAPSAAPAASAPPSSTPEPSAAAAPAAPAAPRSDCPKGSSGPGTFDQPCEAKGAARLMEATWNGKTDAKGPFFKVTNKSTMPILYGKIDVYFYDKAGKPLEVADSNGKAHPFQGCGGNIFSGVMKAGEKAVIQFSCVKKDHVPEGTAAIEAELVMVGFADAGEKKSEFYWKNDALSPEVRKKGGVKK